MEYAMFAGGCFWCMVTPFEELPGIQGIVSGYAGGWKENPAYEEVKSGTTGHYEVVQITFDPEVFPYGKLPKHPERRLRPAKDLKVRL